MTLVNAECLQTLAKQTNAKLKGAATDVRYYARSKLSMSLVHDKIFSLIWQVVFNLGHIFSQEK